MYRSDNQADRATNLSGIVFWITGLPRSGKSTLASALAAAIRATGRPVAALDGDAVRRACGNDLGFDERGRLANARRLNGLCHLLSSQGLTVVCSTVSLIAEVHALNRDTLKSYVEVLIKVPIDVLRRRDPDLYAAAERGDALLPGVNQSFDYPICPHVLLEQTGDDLLLEHAVRELLKWMD